MDAGIVTRVRERAAGCCEYCRLLSVAHPALFQIDHIVARQHVGGDGLDNLAFACIHCNRYKRPNIAGIDPDTGEVTRLFNPRKDEWSRHFRWNGPEIVPLTPVAQHRSLRSG